VCECAFVHRGVGKWEQVLAFAVLIYLLVGPKKRGKRYEIAQFVGSGTLEYQFAGLNATIIFLLAATFLLFHPVRGSLTKYPRHGYSIACADPTSILLADLHPVSISPR
jgi:hypothetical protein